MGSALRFLGRLQMLERRGPFHENRLRLKLISQLAAPLTEESQRLDSFHQELVARRSEWLLPPVSALVEELIWDTSRLAQRARLGAKLANISDSLAAEGSRRRYLVLLLNNAELRGAGGIPSGIGTVRVADGRVTLGRFYLLQELRGARPYAQVRAPKDFRERYGRYLAHTSFWINTTLSPDVPDVALVAARLFRKTVGVSTHGVLVVDPRGLSSILPPGATLVVPGTERNLTAEALPDYVYWHQYEEFGGTNPQRKRALLALGRKIFRAAIAGDQGRPDLHRIGAALAGGHIRFVPFSSAESDIVERIGVAGEVPSANGDSMYVVGQNFGGDKLDYWTRERHSHRCRVSTSAAVCETTTMIENRVRRGLPRFIARPTHANSRSYGVVKRFVEIFIPSDAEVTRASVDGQTATVYPSREDGHQVIAFDMEIRPGTRSVASVQYDLSILDDRYTLEVATQPVAHDAIVDIHLDLPRGWLVYGTRPSSAPFHYSAPLTGRLEFTAGPDPAIGVAKLWNGSTGW